MRIIIGAALAAVVSTAVWAQQGNESRVLTSLSGNPVTVTKWYKQTIYDPSDTKVGEIEDVLVDQKDGHIAALIVGVGGFLGIGEKKVALQFNAVKATKKNNAWYLTTSATKDELKSAPGFVYDKTSTTWLIDSRAR